MNVSAVAELRRIDRAVTAFLDEWTARTKRRNAVGSALEQLSRIVSPGEQHYPSLPGRLADLEEWIRRYGEEITGGGVRRSELEELVVAAEQIVSLRETGCPGASTDERKKLEALLESLVRLIRAGSRRLGLEYTPAGLIEAPSDLRQSSERIRQSLLERLQGFEDPKAAFRKSLDFQIERLSYFYQDDTHLLTVLDYQLKNLESRPNPDDELLAASLIYFLRQRNYQVTPYVKRFRRLLSTRGALQPWEDIER